MADNCCNIPLSVEQTRNIRLEVSGDGFGTSYELPTMSSDIKGGAKLGEGLTVDENERLGIEDGGVSEAKLGDGAVTSSKLADGAVTTDKLDAQAVDETKLADSAVTGAKLADNAVTSSKLSDGAVTLSKLASDVTDMIDGSVRAFETVADMQAATDLEAGMIAHTNGFHASGDGGAAFYEITNSGTANGMDVLACGSLFANLETDMNNPACFGADSNGAYDSIDAINRCIEVNAGNEIHFSNGTYAISAPITIPFAKNLRVSIDFGGATIKPINVMDCCLLLGGSETSNLEPDNKQGGRWFYRNGTISNNSNYSTTGVIVASGTRSDDASKYVSFTGASLQGMKIYNFGTAIQIGRFAGLSPADFYMSDCILRREFASGTKGVDCKSTDINIEDSRIYGYQNAIYSDSSSGIAISRVHNLDNGASTYSDIESMSFLYSNNSGGGYVIDNCYCDTCGTFVKFASSSRIARYALTLANSVMYSAGGIAHNMHVIDMSASGISNGNMGEVNFVIEGNQFFFTTKRTFNAGIIFPSGANMQMILPNNVLSIGNNNIIRAENLQPGDLLLGEDTAITPYVGNVTYASDEWLPIARVPLCLNHSNIISFEVLTPFNSLEHYKLQAKVLMNANGTVGSGVLKKQIVNNTAAIFAFAFDVVSTDFNVYELVLYCRSSASNVNSQITVNLVSGQYGKVISPIALKVMNALASANKISVTPTYNES